MKKVSREAKKIASTYHYHLTRDGKTWLCTISELSTTKRHDTPSTAFRNALEEAEQTIQKWLDNAVKPPEPAQN